MLGVEHLLNGEKKLHKVEYLMCVYESLSDLK